MIASDALDALREQFPACELIAFADLSSDMVLATSAENTLMQERWDGLCAMAHDVFQSAAAHKALACLKDDQSQTLVHAAIVTADECDIFLSCAHAPDYVLCAVGGSHLPVGLFYDAAQPVLDLLVQDD